MFGCEPSFYECFKKADYSRNRYKITALQAGDIEPGNTCLLRKAPGIHTGMT